jgi:uncharacterized protein YneF (UPF0154 family)
MALLLLLGVIAWYYLHLRKPKSALAENPRP